MIDWSKEWHQPVSNFKWISKEEFEREFPYRDKWEILAAQEGCRKELVFVCKCGAELDPCTPSFQTLIDCSRAEGWSMKWLDEGYETRCPGCARK